MSFTADQKKVIVAGKVTGLSNLALAFDLKDKTGLMKAPATLGKEIKASEEIKDAIDMTKTYVIDNLDDIIEVEDDKNFSSDEKKVIIAGKIAGLSNVELTFDLNEKTGRMIGPYVLGKHVKDSKDIQDAITAAKDHVIENLDDIVEVEDD